jgi:hypothetical protein
VVQALALSRAFGYQARIPKMESPR